jgi:hypothetical protein
MSVQDTVCELLSNAVESLNAVLVNDDRFIPRRILLQVFAMAPPPDARSRKALEGSA